MNASRGLASLALLVTTGLMACSDYSYTSQGKGEGAGDGSGGNTDDTGSTDDPGVCEDQAWGVEDIGFTDVCPEPHDGSFTPIVEWDFGAGAGCLSLPVVGDLDGDGVPEIAYNQTDLLGFSGTLKVVSGDGSGLKWTGSHTDLAYGSPPAMGDVDGDGSPDVVVVREHESSLYGDGDYSAAMYDASGAVVWESDHFIGLDFDWATAPVIVDMDHDGFNEVVLGRVILNDDGSTRGIGEYGRGSYGVASVFGFTVSESSVPAVTDLDLDGQDEIITGNAMYDVDGNAIWKDTSQEDGYVGIANLDSDPEGEFVAVSYNTVRGVDTDGTVLWGPHTLASANILSVPTIGDIDLDGEVEIVVAGGNFLTAFNHDGTELWRTSAHDESGATGASLFDFEGDGEPEVVYIDELQMQAFAGSDGSLKFYSADHASNTMMDYPVIADVDADDQAEIVVCHNGHSSAISVYGDQDESWRNARKVWNQHAYGISNVNDDLSIPTTQVPNFEDTNTWHSAIALTGEELALDLEAEILDVCLDECDSGTILVSWRMRNPSYEDVPAGVNLALYADFGGSMVLVETFSTDAVATTGTATEGVTLELDATKVYGADALWLRADDDGTGTGVFEECSEENNLVTWNGPFCD